MSKTVCFVVALVVKPLWHHRGTILHPLVLEMQEGSGVSPITYMKQSVWLTSWSFLKKDVWEPFSRHALARNISRKGRWKLFRQQPKQAHGGMETTLRGPRGYCLQGQREAAPQGVRKHALGASKMRRAGVGNGPAAAAKSAPPLGRIGTAPGLEPVSRILKNRFQEEQKLSPILGADSEPKTGLIFRARY